MKITTCALVIINKDGDILACHGYGKPKENGYDFPKGCYDENTDKDHLSTALRELKEETGIILNPCNDNISIIDAGIHPHTKHKDIHIFIYKTDTFPDINALKCTSFFIDKHGNQKPEMDYFSIIHKQDRNKYFYHVLQNKFQLIDNLNEK